MSNTTRRNLLKSGAALAGAVNLATSSTAAAATLPPIGGSHWERPPKQQGNNLNVILLVADTFRADNLAAYGSQWIETHRT